MLYVKLTICLNDQDHLYILVWMLLAYNIINLTHITA
jgi:hypothetical protein